MSNADASFIEASVGGKWARRTLGVHTVEWKG
jgi:hypothetical protein